MPVGIATRANNTFCDRNLALMTSPPLAPNPVWAVKITTELPTATAKQRERFWSVGFIPTVGMVATPAPIGWGIGARRKAEG